MQSAIFCLAADLLSVRIIVFKTLHPLSEAASRHCHRNCHHNPHRHYQHHRHRHGIDRCTSRLFRILLLQFKPPQALMLAWSQHNCLQCARHQAHNEMHHVAYRKVRNDSLAVLIELALYFSCISYLESMTQGRRGRNRGTRRKLQKRHTTARKCKHTS